MLKFMKTKTLINKKMVRYCQSMKLDLLVSISSVERASNIAVMDDMKNWSYKELDVYSGFLAGTIRDKIPKDCKTIAGFNGSNVYYVLSMITCWKLGMRFLPLCPTHPRHELEYFLKDSDSGMILYSPVNSSLTNETENLINSFELLNLNIHNHLKSYKIEHINSYSNEKSCSDEEQSKGGLILYTSGTTGLPKGVYHNNSNLNHMISSLVIAWEYNQTDKLLHFLPLHHLHGVLNKLLCMLYAGGTIQFCSNANAVNIFKLLAMNGKEIVQYQQNMSNHTKLSINEPNLTLFMAVPTIYAKMIGEVHNLASIHNLTLDKMRQYLLDRSITDLLQYENPNTSVSETNKKSKSALTLLDLKYALFSISRMRLMVSGSAALPDNILDQWLTLTGQTLLERYGMTEIGMALSNPLKGVRRTGYVGMPLPYVKCKIVNDNEQTVTEVDTPGELRVKSPTVFKEYLNRPKETKESFDEEGYFKTGDVSSVGSDGYYKILGRSSVDIIKSGGYKLSSLEIEREILSHPQVVETAVFGINDELFGEKVVAVIVIQNSDMEGSSEVDSLKSEKFIEDMKNHLKDRLATYKQPKIFRIMTSIPRNHLGKVNKKSLRKDLGY